MSAPRPRPAGCRRSWRVPLLVLGFVGLFAGAGAGLARLGWTHARGRRRRPPRCTAR